MGRKTLASIVFILVTLYLGIVAKNMEWERGYTYLKRLSILSIPVTFGVGIMNRGMVTGFGAALIKLGGYTFGHIIFMIIFGMLMQVVEEKWFDDGGGAPTAEELEKQYGQEDENSEWDFVPLA